MKSLGFIFRETRERAGEDVLSGEWGTVVHVQVSLKEALEICKIGHGDEGIQRCPDWSGKTQGADREGIFDVQSLGGSGETPRGDIGERRIGVWNSKRGPSGDSHVGTMGTQWRLKVGAWIKSLRRARPEARRRKGSSRPWTSCLGFNLGYVTEGKLLNLSLPYCLPLPCQEQYPFPRVTWLMTEQLTMALYRCCYIE